MANNDLNYILKKIVALSNLIGGEIFIENYDFDQLELEIKKNIINAPDYWLKNRENGFIINIKSNGEDTFLKNKTEFGYEFVRYVINDEQVVPATEEMRENLLISEKQILVKCNSFIGDNEIVDTREIDNKINKIKDDLILFVKRNLLYSKEKLWNINPERVENAINKALYEYSHENNFPIELSIFDSKKLVIKYFLGNKKDRRFVENIIVNDDYLFGNKIRVLTLSSDDNVNTKILSHAKNSSGILSHTENSKGVSQTHTEHLSTQHTHDAQIEHPTINNLDIILNAVKEPVTSKDIMNALGLKDRETFYNNYLKPAIREGFVQYTIPEKPRSPKQKYVITDKGLEILQ
jgi:hypothetical protein